MHWRYVEQMGRNEEVAAQALEGTWSYMLASRSTDSCSARNSYIQCQTGTAEAFAAKKSKQNLTGCSWTKTIEIQSSATQLSGHSTAAVEPHA